MREGCPFGSNMGVVFKYGGFYDCYVMPCMHKHREDHSPGTVVHRVRHLMTSNIMRIVLLKRGIGSCKGGLRRPVAFTRLLRRVRGVRKLREVHFVASRPGSLSSRLVRIVDGSGGVYGRLRLPIRSKDDQVLGLVGHRCSGRRCLTLTRGVHGTIPSVSLAASVVINFPNRARRSFRRALSIMEGIHCSDTFAFVCSGHAKAPTTMVRSRVPRSIMGSHFGHLLRRIRAVSTRRYTVRRKAMRAILMRYIGRRSGRLVANHVDGGLLIRFPKSRDLVNRLISIRLSRYGKFCCVKEVRDGWV